MNSAEGERVAFTLPVTAIGNVENWLGDVESMMRTSLFDLAKEAMLCYPPDGDAAVDRGDWFFEFPAQVHSSLCALGCYQLFCPLDVVS
jgi:hypothetical protein